MAKLSARGRTELYRIERKFTPVDYMAGTGEDRACNEQGFCGRKKYFFMSDGNILQEKFFWETSPYSASKWHSFGKTVKGKMTVEKMAAEVSRLIASGKWEEVKK